MKNIIISLFALLIFNSSLKAQANKFNIENDKQFIELINQLEKFYFSEQNLTEFNLSNDFFEKIGTIKIEDTEIFNKDFKFWFKNNFNNTTFESLDEGLQLYTKLNETTTLNDLQRKKMSSSFKQLQEKYGFDEFVKYYNQAIN